MNNINIGKKGKEVNSIFREYGLVPLRNILTREDFEKTADKTIKWKRRKRILIPEVVFWLVGMVGISCASMGMALNKAWEHIRLQGEEIPAKVASEAAFTKARNKLPLNFFKKISDLVREYFYKQYSNVGYWKGLRVKIVDGITVILPECKKKVICY